MATRQPAAERAIDSCDTERRQRPIRCREPVGREGAVKLARAQQQLEGIATGGRGAGHPHTFA